MDFLLKLHKLSMQLHILNPLKLVLRDKPLIITEILKLLSCRKKPAFSRVRTFLMAVGQSELYTIIGSGTNLGDFMFGVQVGLGPFIYHAMQLGWGGQPFFSSSNCKPTLIWRPQTQNNA